MMGEADTFDYVLASDLGMSLAAVRELDAFEVVEWRSWYRYRQAMDEVGR